MKKRILISMLLMCFVFSGCDVVNKLFPQRRKVSMEPAPILTEVNDLELAKLILRPEEEKKDFNIDPFKPLAGGEIGSVKRAAQSESSRSGVVYIEGIGEVRFVGVIKSNDEYFALLKTNKGKGTYKVGDNLENYRVTEIENNKIILTDGSQTIIIERGTEK